MIVCSCNVFSDDQVRSAIASCPQQPRMSRIYASLGCAAQCGRCAHTIKNIVQELSTALSLSAGALAPAGRSS
jgi:bacterioferritin-associated ferredoxin